MSEIEKKDMENGLEELGEDALSEVAGGKGEPATGKFIISDEEAKKAKEQALADGRTINLPSGTWWALSPSELFCLCHHEYKWCRAKDGKVAFIEVKCYNCGKTWSRLSLSATVE